jgi:hypothetical protein
MLPRARPEAIDVRSEPVVGQTPRAASEAAEIASVTCGSFR